MQSTVPGAMGPTGYLNPNMPGSGENSPRIGGSVGSGGLGGGPSSPVSGLRMPTTQTSSDEKPAKSTPAQTQSRTALTNGSMMPGMPSMPATTAGGGAPDGKDKKRRKEPARSEDRDAEPVEGDPWQRSGWPTGNR